MVFLLGGKETVVNLARKEMTGIKMVVGDVLIIFPVRFLIFLFLTKIPPEGAGKGQSFFEFRNIPGDIVWIDRF